MARQLRIKKNSDAHYHLMSRTNDKRFLFKDGVMKTELVSAMRRAAEFCGVQIKAYTAMDNHFHVVVKVTKPEEPVCETELLRRVGVLKGECAMRLLSEHWSELSSAGFEATLKSEQDRFRARMNDISEFIKLFKEIFDRIYKREHEEISLFAGFDPREGRVVQIGEGKVFGSAGFVRMWIAGMASRHKDAHEVMGIGSNEPVGYSSHGWRLADAQRERSGLVGKSGVTPFKKTR